MHRTLTIPPPFLPLSIIFCIPFDSSFSDSKEQPFIDSVTNSLVSSKLIFESKNSAIKVSDCIFSESTLLSESEDEDKSVKLCTLVSAVVTAVVVCAVGGEIVPQAVIIIAIAAENIAEYIFFIHKFSFFND